MKFKMAILAILFAAFALPFSIATPASPGSRAVSAAASKAAPTPAAAPAPAPADHPEIREALASLRRAKDHLEHAAHDYKGHRVEAIRAIDNAINQLEICLKFD